MHTDTSNERYATVNGATAGELPFKNPLPLPMWVVPPLTPLPSDERDSTLAAKIDAQLAAYLDADVRVFVFLCPLEIAKRVAAAMYASGQYGAGYAIVLTPHLASTLLVSDASLFKVFNGALQVQFYKWAKDMFTTAFVNANGKSPGTVNAISSNDMQHRRSSFLQFIVACNFAHLAQASLRTRRTTQH